MFQKKKKKNPKYNNSAWTPEFRTRWFRSPPTLWCLGTFISVLTSPSLFHNGPVFHRMISDVFFPSNVQGNAVFMNITYTYCATPGLLGECFSPLSPSCSTQPQPSQMMVIENGWSVALVLKWGASVTPDQYRRCLCGTLGVVSMDRSSQNR